MFVNSLHLVHRIPIRNRYTREIMWNPICDWVVLSSILKRPAEDAVDRSGNTLLVGAADNDYQRCSYTTDLCNPEMTDPLKIQQDYAIDYAKDYRVHTNKERKRQTGSNSTSVHTAKGHDEKAKGR